MYSIDHISLQLSCEVTLCWLSWYEMLFLAHRIRIPEILPWDRKSYLTHATRDDPKVLIVACYLCNQQCNMPENCTIYKYILCLFTALTIFM